MSLPAVAAVRLFLAVAILTIVAARRVNAQASGVLQATVRVLPSRPGPGARALKAHGPRLATAGGSVRVHAADSTSQARIDLDVLEDRGARFRRLRVTVLYLR